MELHLPADRPDPPVFDFEKASFRLEAPARSLNSIKTLPQKWKG